jgi:hypothetical protein
VRARFEPQGAAGATFRRYFAEGAVGDLFDARIVLVNSGGRDTTARLRFLRDDGVTIAHDVAVPALASARVDAAGIAGLRGHAFSTVIESDVPLVADRTMAWKGRDGRAYGAHAETSIASPAPRWFLAEGATHAGFDLFYLLQNPHDVPVRTRVTYLRAAAPPLERVVVLPPRSRTSIWVDQEAFGPDAARLLASTELSAVIESLDGPGIVVERAMYDTRNGVTFEAGHESAGVTAPARRWYFAEGATGAFFDQFLLVANPNDAAVDLQVTYLLPDGSRQERRHRVQGRSRYTIWVDQEGEALADTAVSTVVEASAPVVVERSMWWPGTSATWREAHNTAGATASALRWAVGDGHGRSLVDGGATYLLARAGAPHRSVRRRAATGHTDRPRRTVLAGRVQRRRPVPGSSGPRLWHAHRECRPHADADHRRARDVCRCAWAAVGHRHGAAGNAAAIGRSTAVRFLLTHEAPRCTRTAR